MTSIQRELGLSLSIGILALWLAATVISSLIVRHELDEAFDSALQETAQQLLSIATLDADDDETEVHDDDADDLPYRTSIRLGEHEELLTYIVREQGGHIVLVSHNARMDTFPEEQWVGFQTTRTHRLYSERAPGTSVTIAIADPLEHRREAWLEATSALVVPLPLLILLSFILVWFVIRRSMRSVHDVRSQIESRSDANLEPLRIGGLPKELSPIAGSVNDLMDRLRRALESERNFATNSAHELRSPIAGALAQVQRLIAELPAGDHQNRARGIEAALSSIAKLSEKLMQLARAEAGFLVAKDVVNLFPVLKLVLDEFNRSGESRNRLQFQCNGVERFMARLDPDGMGILIRNVIENALKHSPAESRIDVILNSGDNEIRVINAGPVLPSDRVESLKTRFVRGATTAAGSGLGLAIVEAVTQGSGVAVELISPATGRTDGFEARLKSPFDGTGDLPSSHTGI